MKPKTKTILPVSSIDEDPTTEYASRVSSGEIIAGPAVRAACSRHLRDIEHGASRGLVWSLEAARDVFAYFEQVLALNGGQYEGKPFVLLDWQLFCLGSLFGWRGADGYRRFRMAYIETGKGSGKSPFVAGMGLYGLTSDFEARAEIYAAAAKKDQAMILFRDAVAMVDQSALLRDMLVKSGSRGKEWNIAYIDKGSFFRPIASDDSQSGPRPHMAFLDEIHEHKDGTVVEQMRAGTKMRRQALIVMITNSGADKTSVCYDYHNYSQQVSSGAIEDDSFFGYVCGVDEGDDPLKSEACWPKANPSLIHGIPGWKYLREQVTQAKGMPSKESIVRRLNFCQWVDASSPFIGSEVWRKCEDRDFDESRLIGRRAFGGLDLSSTKDLTAFVLQFEPSEDDPFWRQKEYFWVPADGLSEKERNDRVPYSAWERDGMIAKLPGVGIDKKLVARDIAKLNELYNISVIAYDRWRIEDFKIQLEDINVNLPLVAFGQGYESMAPAVDEYESRLINATLRHPGNACMTWNAANSVVDIDPAGNRKLSKRKAIGRIDGMVAAVMASGISKKEQKGPSVYTKRGVRSL